MSWERRGQNLYYTRSRRQNGHIIREFVGSDGLAKVAAEQDQHKREVQIQLAADIRAVISQLRYAQHLLRKVRQLVRIAVHNAMSERGYHQHARSTWRKARRSRTVTTFQDETADTEEDFMDDPLLQIFPEDLIDETNAPAGTVNQPPPATEPATGLESDSNSDSPLRNPPGDLFMVRKAKESLFRVLGIAADSRTIFEDDLREIWNKVTLPGDPPAVLMLADQYLLEWLRFHVNVIMQNKYSASESHIKLIESFQKGANSASKHLVDLAKQIITIRKTLASDSPTSSPNKSASPKPSSKSQPKFRNPSKAEVPTNRVPA